MFRGINLWLHSQSIAQQHHQIDTTPTLKLMHKHLLYNLQIKNSVFTICYKPRPPMTEKGITLQN